LAHKPKTVAREMVKNAAVDADKPLDLSIRNAAADENSLYASKFDKSLSR
jgi:hypothetical protein